MARARARHTDVESESTSGNWLVKLENNKPAVVEANSRELAIERYKEVMGIKNTVHDFDAEELASVDHLTLDEFGVVVEERAPNADDE